MASIYKNRNMFPWYINWFHGFLTVLDGLIMFLSLGIIGSSMGINHSMKYLVDNFEDLAESSYLKREKEKEKR